MRRGRVRSLGSEYSLSSSVSGSIVAIYVVRARAVLELVSLRLAGLRVEVRDVVSNLADEPDSAGLVHDRIARTSPLPGYRPLLRLERGVLRQRRDRATDHERSNA